MLFAVKALAVIFFLYIFTDETTSCKCKKEGELCNHYAQNCCLDLYCMNGWTGSDGKRVPSRCVIHPMKKLIQEWSDYIQS
ncbi:unnamed protein product [Hymenolepis diminuta]|uniref:Uncharacterized protein n=1 Tax=Hymenolepis diminuta TaxID=6216 RepID=A0A564ZCB4_HYMDI|nr:unnamed protein product [Hymenolepis diminuta]